MCHFMCRESLETIESISCTDVKQKWGRLKKKKEELYEIVPLEKFCHVKIPNQKYNVVLSQEEADNAFQSILEGKNIDIICSDPCLLN